MLNKNSCLILIMFAMYINFCLLLKLNFVLHFLKFAGTRTCPQVRGYLRIAGTDPGFYPSRVAGAGTGFGLRVRVSKVSICGGFYRLPSIAARARRALHTHHARYSLRQVC